ncbi:hypothetical protein QBC43DRAFT_381676 [Cladorrhinum sp. PSN259]|nr:hypothetical protein QBC43DRAFT_381676 [Cladorrhinum sp. PSN259]
MDAFAGEAFDIPDPTDWLNTPLAGLMPVEQTLRCHVCKDFFTSPMLTSCNHTFCSICIRRCLQADQKCPLCRKEDSESRLRGNWALRETVEAFVQVRDAILQFAKAPPPPPPPAPVAAATRSPKRKARNLDEADEENQESKRPRRSNRSTSRAQQGSQQEEIEDYEVEESGSEEDAYVSEPDDGLVSCPVCSRRMKLEKVDRHLDTSCPGPDAGSSPPPPKSSKSRGVLLSGHRGGNASHPSPSSYSSPHKPQSQLPPAQRLPALPYSMLKDTALRKKLSELGISTSGPRPILEKRHQEWVTLWNANCDSHQPKTRQELLHDLNVWEKTIGVRAPTSSKAVVVGQQIKDKDFDGKGWAVKHGTEFKDLIASARRSKMLAQKKNEEGAMEEEEEKQRGEEQRERQRERDRGGETDGGRRGKSCRE